MEDVLAVYTRPRRIPIARSFASTEASKQLIAETPAPRSRWKTQAARPVATTSTSATAGTADLLDDRVRAARRLALHQGHRSATAVDYAHVLKDLANLLLPRHQGHCSRQRQPQRRQQTSAFFQVIPAAEAQRLVERFEWHPAPKHGSRHDLRAEWGLTVLSSQCLDRRIPDKQNPLADEKIAAWEQDRDKNNASGGISTTQPRTLTSITITYYISI